MANNKIRELSSGGDTGGSIRFTGKNTTVALPPRPFPRLIITGTISSLGEGEHRGDIVYNFKISPLAQDLKGDDRVFTFSLYAGTHRNTPKHSTQRQFIASVLRKRHALIWDRFHEAMGTR
jgi:hypothetical protein